jgi:SAM-dependent methyltransferase
MAAAPETLNLPTLNPLMRPWRQRMRALGWRISRHARAKRAEQFRRTFNLTAETRVLDLGGGDGAHIRSVLTGTPVKPRNVCIADIETPRLAEASRYGYQPVQLAESGRLPFEDGHFDIVFCSSVIEHVTTDKADIWTIPPRDFARQALVHQNAFAAEIRRIGKSFWVQCPAYECFFETHLKLPFVHWLPRSVLLRASRWSKRYWISGHRPDYHLLKKAHMEALFPGAKIMAERFCGLAKSWIAVKT